jgi:hypothetical protein
MTSDYKLRMPIFARKEKTKSSEVTILPEKFLKQNKRFTITLIPSQLCCANRGEPVFRNGPDHRKIRLIEGNAKCRHLKN